MMMSTTSDATDAGKIDLDGSKSNEFPFVGVVLLSKMQTISGGGWFSKRGQSKTGKPQRVRLSVCPAVVGQSPARWLVESDFKDLCGAENGNSTHLATTTKTTKTTTGSHSHCELSCIGLSDAQACSSNRTQVILSFVHCRDTYRVECDTSQQAHKLRQATVKVCPHEIYANISTSNISSAVKAGDVVLIRTSGIASEVQRFFTRCQWDHVAIALPEDWGIMLYMGGHLDTLSLYEATSADGVFSCPLRARIEQYLECNNDEVEVAVRHLITLETTTGSAGGEGRCALNWEQLRMEYQASLGQEYSFRGLVGTTTTSTTSTLLESPSDAKQEQQQGECAGSPPPCADSRQEECNSRELMSTRRGSISKINVDPGHCDVPIDEGGERSSGDMIKMSMQDRNDGGDGDGKSSLNSMIPTTAATSSISTPTSSSGYFCSELVASCFITLGVLDPNLRKRPGYYWPSSFVPGKSIDQHMAAGFRLSEPMFVDLVTHDWS